MDLGVKAGLNVSGLGLSSEGKLAQVNYHNRTGYHVGVYASIRFSKWAIQPEIVYSTQGQNFTTPNYRNLSSDLNYINVPVLAKYYVIGPVYVTAGPQIGFLAGATGDLIQIVNTNIGGYELRKDMSAYVNPIDFSFAMGAGFEVPFGLSASFRYNLGISDINKNSGASATVNPKASFSTAQTQNQVIQVSIGYRIMKKGK
ncbi:hypothetical protein WSM22_28630 [Cytophagales bacterium WSM2-2]|nr:hypothetical protein WSM22_28630 [Cytophagales bacterium WSM2-2]